MAEGFLRSFDPAVEVYSAGTRAEGQVNPNAVRVMKEAGLDISKGVPDPVEKYLGQNFDYVITVCDGAKEVCPVFHGRVGEQLHIGFDDPADARGTDEEVLAVFRRIRDEIRIAFHTFYVQKLKKAD
jgi:arsenate reductase